MRCIVDGSVLQIFSINWQGLLQTDSVTNFVILPSSREDEVTHEIHLNILAALLRQRCRALGSVRRLRGPGSLLKDVIPRSVHVVMNSSSRSSLHTVSRRRNLWYMSWSSMGKSPRNSRSVYFLRMGCRNVGGPLGNGVRISISVLVSPRLLVTPFAVSWLLGCSLRRYGYTYSPSSPS